MPPDQRPPSPGYLTLLRRGDVEVLGRLPWSSNRTFLVTCAHRGQELPAVYKPARGERRLWDFPDCLYRREVAAYRLSELLGWGLVPDTVERADAPFGPGSLQRFVPADFSEHHFTLVEDEQHHDRLRTVCAFDVVANNADRKSGHCLLGEDGTIWAIDNGLCFHADEHKLRTVIWEFAGEPVPSPLLEDLGRVGAELHGALGDLLSRAEIDAVRRRVERLVSTGRYPVPDADRYHFPWPLV